MYTFYDMDTTHVGILFPGHSGEADYPLAARAYGGSIEIDLEHTPVEIDVHREDALRLTGRDELLRPGASALAARGARSVMWACTSASFVFGLAGARDQAKAVEDAAGVPASSTSLAFVAALEALGIARVAVAATYPADVTALFTGLLADAGVEVLGSRSLGLLTSGEVAALDRARAAEVVHAADDPRAEAVLLPDTALPSLSWLDAVERDVGKPVISANQASVWQALRLAGLPDRRRGLGRLLAEA